MPYFPPATSASGSGFNVYYVTSTQTLDVPVNFENICTTILTIDGIIQLEGKATVL